MNARGDDIPVALSSRYSGQDVSRRFSTLSLAGVIKKPYALHEIEDKIDHAMNMTGSDEGR